MATESSNLLNGGMFSDISKLFQGKNTYLKSVNFRPLTELGQSNGSLVTIKGNECSVGFPTLQKVFKFKVFNSTDASTTVYFTINNIASDPIVINNSTTAKDIYTVLKSMPNCYQSTGMAFPYNNFNVAYNEEYVVIYQSPEYTGCGAVSSAVSVKVTTTVQGVNNYLIFLNANGATQNAPINPLPYINSVNSNLSIIGSTFLGNNIYLFTCPTTNPNGLGQIFKLSYNEVSNITTIKLIFNGYIGLSTDYTIPPTAALGRYEIDSIQRIYWTDFYNPVRSCNVEDPNLMVYTEDILNLKPNVTSDIPILSGWGDGGAVVSLDAGSILQCAYRLKKNNGAITNYSNLSNQVYLVEQNITNQVSSDKFNLLQGTVTASTVNKTFTWTVNNVDTSFDIIEFIVVIRSYTGAYNIYKYEEKIINGLTSVSSTFTNNNTEFEEITLEEFLLDTIFFDTCKTIETKDNRLFFGNIKRSFVQVLEDFDTRAYRFRGNSSEIGLLRMEADNSITLYDMNVIGYEDIPTDEDNIPLHNLGFDAGTDPGYNIIHRYLRNSSELGGEGPNIKFRFGTQLLRTDQSPNEPNKGAGDFRTGTDMDDNTNQTSGFASGYRVPGDTGGVWSYIFNLNPTNLLTDGHIYPSYNTKQSMGHECFGGLFKSYMHNEIYRFAIVFKDKYGQSYFAKHIADVKFPNYGDVNSNGGTSFNGAVTDFRSLYELSYSNVLYIKFEVTIPQEIAEVISGWEIVRVPREEKDRVVRSYGMINQCTYGDGGSNNNMYLPMPYQGGSIGGINNDLLNPRTYTGPDNVPVVHKASPYCLTYHSFDFLDGPEQNYFSVGDRLYITEVYNRSITGACNPTSAFLGSENMYYVTKFSNLSVLGFTRYNVGGMAYAGLGETAVPVIGNLVGAITYNNYDIDASNAPNYNSNSSHSLGSPAHFIALNDYPIDWSSTMRNNFSSVQHPYQRKALAQYIKPTRLPLQYGGRTYLARSNNEYISTGCLQKVDGAGTYSAIVFGGDIYHSMLDIQKAVKNWGQTNRPTIGDKCSQTFFFPTQSIHNVDLRVGSHVNRDLNSDSSSLAAAYDEYNYYGSYSYENDLKKYYPRPVFFNETDKWINRVYYSDVKINGENSDSWSNIQANNFYDVEGNYGGITALSILRNNMYYIQEQALGILDINPTSVVTDGNGLPLLLGTGDVIQKHRYISIDSGSKHQWSIARSQNMFIFADIRNKKVWAFNGESISSISDLKGNKNYFIKKFNNSSVLLNDNPILGKGILSTYDYYHDEFLITTLDTRQEVINQGGEPIDIEVKDYSTIAYSGLTNTFTGLYSFAPYIYLNNNSRLFSTNSFTTTKLYMHNIGNYNTFYGTKYKSYIQVVVNDNPSKTKVFDNILFNTESIKDGTLRLDDFTNVDPLINVSDNQVYASDTFQRLRCYNDYQNTDWVTLNQTDPIDNIRKTEQGWNTFVPRNKVDYDTQSSEGTSIFSPTVLTKTLWGERIRDKYMIVELEYDNTLNNRFIVHNINTLYRISDR